MGFWRRNSEDEALRPVSRTDTERAPKHRRHMATAATAAVHKRMGTEVT